MLNGRWLPLTPTGSHGFIGYYGVVGGVDPSCALAPCLAGIDYRVRAIGDGVRSHPSIPSWMSAPRS